MKEFLLKLVKDRQRWLYCLQNNGRLSAKKRASHFDFLLVEEIASLEQAVQSAWGSETLNNKR